MKKTAIAIVAIAGLIGGPALSADMAVKGPPPAPITSWVGLYGGLSLGARWAANDWTTTGFGPLATAAGLRPGSDAEQPFDSTAARIGGYAGYNWQVATAWVVGAEADLGWANNNKTRIAIPGTTHPTIGNVTLTALTSGDTSSVGESWDGSLRARLGFLITPAILIYGAGGAALQQVQLAATCAVNPALGTACSFPLAITTHVESVPKTLAGWTIGAGVEHMASGNWLFRGEYRYAYFGTTNHLFFGSDINATLNLDDLIYTKTNIATHTVLAGFAYRL